MSQAPVVEKAEFYVFHPEEPEMHIFVSGRMLHFTNGRLEEYRDGLTQGDLAWFQHESPRFIVTNDLAESELEHALYKRVTRMVGRRAHSSDLSTTMNESELMTGLMLGRESQRSIVTMDDAISALKGTFGAQNEGFEEAEAQVEDAREDAEAIARGAGSSDPDLVTPETEPQQTGDGELPTQFVAPTLAGPKDQFDPPGG